MCRATKNIVIDPKWQRVIVEVLMLLNTLAETRRPIRMFNNKKKAIQ